MKHSQSNSEFDAVAAVDRARAPTLPRRSERGLAIVSETNNSSFKATSGG